MLIGLGVWYSFVFNIVGVSYLWECDVLLIGIVGWDDFEFNIVEVFCLWIIVLWWVFEGEMLF